MAISHRQCSINERGVTYLMLMFAIVLIGIATTAAAKQWKTTVQREREMDLLAKGIEIQNALALYIPDPAFPMRTVDCLRPIKKRGP